MMVHPFSAVSSTCIWVSGMRLSYRDPEVRGPGLRGRPVAS